MNTASWRSPSNIALVKYWGKFAQQLPANPSISFTLSTSSTDTILSWEPATNGGHVEVIFEGEPAPHFAPKIEQYFERIAQWLPFFKDYNYRIETTNTFPHSSGIASSASGMSALAMCTVTMAKKLGVEFNNERQMASNMARLGSGSASRSVYGPMAVWGKHDEIEGSSDDFAIPYTHINPVYETYQDYILLVDKGQKKVSSTAGHDLMKRHPYAKTRFMHAHANLSELTMYLTNGDLMEFGGLVESEALTLHAMMMTSRPYFMLFKPNTISIIEKVWAFRKDTKTPVHFTLDAGANVHLLFPESAKQSVDDFVRNDLIGFCKQGEYLCDHVGHGPEQIR